MKSRRRTLSPRELALIAAALLVPVPLLVQTGLSLPLPNAVERSLGSLVTLGVEDERSGPGVAVQALVNTADGRRSGRAAAAITSTARGAVTIERLRGSRKTTPSGSAGAEGGDAPAGHEPKGGDGPHDPSPGGADAPADDGGDGSRTEPSHKPGASLTVAAPGASAGASAGGDAISVDLGAGSVPAGDGLTGAARVEVTDTSGSSTGADVAIPTPPTSLP